VRRHHTRPADFARLGIDPLSRDLRPILIKSITIAMRSPLLASNLTRAAVSPTHHIP
jgi:hypothetical protein